MSWRRGERLPLRHDELPREPGLPSKAHNAGCTRARPGRNVFPDLCFQAGNHNAVQRRHLNAAEMARETGHRVTVAVPTTRDKPHGIGIVFEKPTELLLLPQAGASRAGKRIHASNVGRETLPSPRRPQ